MTVDLSSWVSKAQTTPDEYLRSSMRMMDVANKQGKDRPFNYNTAIAQYRGWIYAAIWMNAKAVATTPLRLYARKGKGESLAKTSPVPLNRRKFIMGKTKRQPSPTVLQKAVEWGGEFEEVTEKNPITDLLARPNKYMLGQEFCCLRLMFTMLTGNFYMHPVVESVRYEGKGLWRIKELWVMPSQFVKIQPGEPNEDDYIKGYWYGVDQTRMHLFEPDEVLHMRQPNPRDQLYGLGQVEAAWDTQRLSIAQRETDQSRYDNLSRPDLAVITKSANVPLAQLKELQEEWARLFRGTFRQGSPVFLSGDTQVIPLAYQPTEIGDKEIIIEEIAAITGVPVSLLKANDPNLASAQVGFASWREQTILPYCRMDEEFLNAHLMPAFGNEESAFLCYDDPVPENRDEVRQDLVAFLSSGMVTRNEARVSEGYDPVEEENADKLLLPAGLVPIDKVGEQPSFGMGSGFSLGGNDRQQQEEDKQKLLAAKALIASAFNSVYQSASIYQKADADDTARDGESERMIRQLQLSVARVFAMQRKACIDATHGRKGPDAGLIARVIAAVIKTDSEMAGAIEPYMNKILSMGGKSGLVDIGLPPDAFDVTNPKVAQFMQQYTVRLAGEINSYTAQELSKTLAEGLDEGESISELANRVSGLYNDFEGYRSEAIARTESARAFTDGTAQAWSDSDAVAGKTWGLASAACKICKAIASKYGTTPIPLDQPFFQLGAAIPLDDGKTYHVDYSAIMGPPGHPNCLLPGSRVSARGIVAAMRARYSGVIKKVTFASGAVLSVTENHKFLTLDGFIRANVLSKGDDVIRECLTQSTASIKPKHNNRPSRIEDIFDSLRVSGQMPTMSVPATSKHLHGDGWFCNGDIDIVFSNRQLGDAIKSPVFKHRRDLPLCAAWSDSKLAGLRNFDSMLVRMSLAANGVMGGSGKPGPLSSGGMGHPCIHAFAPVTGRKSSGNHVSFDDAPADTQSLRSTFEAFPGLVTLDKVVNIESRDYSGHVYDLQTESGLYSGNGIYTSNCRCTIKAVLK